MLLATACTPLANRAPQFGSATVFATDRREEVAHAPGVAVSDEVRAYREACSRGGFKQDCRKSLQYGRSVRNFPITAGKIIYMAAAVTGVAPGQHVVSYDLRTPVGTSTIHQMEINVGQKPSTVTHYLEYKLTLGDNASIGQHTVVTNLDGKLVGSTTFTLIQPGKKPDF